MTKIFMDWEFLERGPFAPIYPISLGMVAEDGRELYAVFEEIQEGEQYHVITKHKWVMDNVVPHLPLLRDGRSFGGGGTDAGWFHLDRNTNLIMPRRMIRNAVREFIQATPRPELWGWYSAYDHVMYAQLFGKMENLPEGFPMCTNDLKTRTLALGITDDEMPRDPGQTVHHALADAREIAQWSAWLDTIERQLMDELKHEIRTHDYQRESEGQWPANTETTVLPAVTDRGETR